jgi:hypothetical protein
MRIVILTTETEDSDIFDANIEQLNNYKEGLDIVCLFGGIRQAKDFNPDAVMVMQNGCIMTPNTLKSFLRELHKGFDLIGFKDCYLGNMGGKRCLYHSGSYGGRKSEPLESWRMVSKELLEELNWDVDLSTLWNDAQSVWKRILNCRDESVVLVDLKKVTEKPRYSTYVNLELTLKQGFAQSYINKILSYV